MIKILLIVVSFLHLVQGNWVSEMEEQLTVMEGTLDGELGVYIKDMSDHRVLSFNCDENWYLASTIKIPLAIALLQKVEAGEISLDDELTLQESDFVDGTGDLLWQQPGTTYTVRELLIKMIRNSDSTATDLLIRLLGEEELNNQIRNYIIRTGINQLTTILQVRYDAYNEIHENAANLSNMDIIQAHSTDTRVERFNTLVELMGIDRAEAKVNSVEEAFERYYESGLNSGKVEAMGVMLERLYEGELLNVKHTAFLLDVMKGVTTGDKRIKAGLPAGTGFAQKTGTQIRRACNMGIIFPEGNQQEPIIIVACAKGYDSLEDAEKVLENLGRLVSRSLLK